MHTDFTIVTQKLILRLTNTSELNSFASLVAQSYSLHRWMDWTHKDFNQAEAEEFILANRLNWAKGSSYGFGVYLKASGEMIGMVAITEFQRTSNMAQVGYWIGDRYQRKGFGIEALNALIEFCFAKLELTRLEIVCDPENIPGHIIALKCGAVEEGLVRNRFIYNGKPKDGLVFSVVPESV
ncbi:GNAT family N-acetyltransferase [Vibrio sp. JC009]|uniref:GNAT family N-acetyltransferase n=1 Tax=Vibrio sp. JC009 TaxID=2912314 RepID=UPI0023B05087|nr:GNAT family protein [Vibrio sp. JC009]WED20811.1 GNAT family N-acetyltransferase [Vibrio sp. JC009]